MVDFTWFAIFVVVNASIVVALALMVSYLRITLRVANGDGGQLAIKKAIRAHMNGVEHVSIFAMVALAMSLLPNANEWLPLLVILFSTGRILHAVGMLRPEFNTRRAGAVFTYISELLGIVSILIALLS